MINGKNYRVDIIVVFPHSNLTYLRGKVRPQAGDLGDMPNLCMETAICLSEIYIASKKVTPFIKPIGRVDRTEIYTHRKKRFCKSV